MWRGRLDMKLPCRSPVSCCSPCRRGGSGRIVPVKPRWKEGWAGGARGTPHVGPRRSCAPSLLSQSAVSWAQTPLHPLSASRVLHRSLPSTSKVFFYMWGLDLNESTKWLQSNFFEAKLHLFTKFNGERVRKCRWLTLAPFWQNFDQFHSAQISSACTEKQKTSL